MNFLPKIRFALFAIVLLFSLVELALCAKNISLTKAGLFIDDGFEILQLSPFFFPFVAFGLAISVLTLVFLIPIMIIDVVRKGAVTSMIAFELAWTGLFWVLWLAVAADATAPGIFKDCNFEDDRVQTLCNQFPAIQGLAFFNWILLLGWWITLLVLAFNARRKVNTPNLWRQSVADVRMSMHEPRPSGVSGTRSNITPAVGMVNYPAPSATNKAMVESSSILAGPAYPQKAREANPFAHGSSDYV
jgi:hypothetical protein